MYANRRQKKKFVRHFNLKNAASDFLLFFFSLSKDSFSLFKLSHYIFTLCSFLTTKPDCTYFNITLWRKTIFRCATLPLSNLIVMTWAGNNYCMSSCLFTFEKCCENATKSKNEASALLVSLKCLIRSIYLLLFHHPYAVDFCGAN